METRRLILERAGHSVTGVRDIREIVAASRDKIFSVAILGQMLPAKEKLRVCEVVRSHCPGTKILELHTGFSPELPSADAHLHVAAGALDKLVNCVNELAAGRKKRGA
jgi:ActR/RegA family two-component response regulator